MLVYLVAYFFTDQAILQMAQINSLKTPRKYDFDFLHRWLNHPCGGDYFLRGIEAESFEPHKMADMVVLSSGSEPGDGLAEYICDKVVPLYHQIFGYRLHRSMQEEDFEETWEYKKKLFTGFGNALCMLLSASVPAISILVLYFMNSMVARLAAIGAMSFLFSLLMTFVLGESRGSVFAATTAFAAVQVVFVGGTNVVGAT
jgi:hypothetical protein